MDVCTAMQEQSRVFLKVPLSVVGMFVFAKAFAHFVQDGPAKALCATYADNSELIARSAGELIRAVPTVERSWTCVTCSLLRRNVGFGPFVRRAESVYGLPPCLVKVFLSSCRLESSVRTFHIVSRRLLRYATVGRQLDSLA